MNHRALLIGSAQANDSTKKISRKIFFLSPSAAFENHYDVQLEIYEDICDQFALPLSAIRLVGSAHTGFSLVKGTLFDATKSDLDIAIVDSALFLRMFEHAFEQTNGWRDASQFSNSANGQAVQSEFLRHLNMGVIRPDLMPSSPKKAMWTNYFGKLSDKYPTFCSGITAGVYASESFMAAKQESAIRKFLAGEMKND